MPEEKKAFLLRVDAKLWAELQAWAAQDFRSANAQIEYLLREAVARRRGGKPKEEGGGPPEGAPPDGQQPKP